MNRMIGLLMLLLSFPSAVIRAEHDAELLAPPVTEDRQPAGYGETPRFVETVADKEARESTEAARTDAAATDPNDYLNGGHFGYGSSW